MAWERILGSVGKCPRDRHGAGRAWQTVTCSHYNWNRGNICNHGSWDTPAVNGGCGNMPLEKRSGRRDDSVYYLPNGGKSLYQPRQENLVDSCNELFNIFPMLDTQANIQLPLNSKHDRRQTKAQNLRHNPPRR